MGLNLETLIGILVILILLILADGVRRMIRERHGRLRMRIDRRFGKGPAAGDDSDDDYPNELIGRPRVRSRDEQGHIDMDRVDEADQDGDRADPPIMMDTAEAPPEPPARRAEQQTLFDADNRDDDAATPEDETLLNAAPDLLTQEKAKFALQRIDAAITVAGSRLSELGAQAKQIERHTTYVGKLADSLEAGIGNLVDADLAKESAKLTALQTKQQLGVQALSIANSSSQSLLSLFR